MLRQVLKRLSRTISTDAERIVTAIHVTNPHKAEFEFSDGMKFEFPAEFLRVYSPAADSKRVTLSGKTKAVSGRRYVGIMSMDAVGNYGVRIVFDDLHNTGIYSWDYLYELGQNKFTLMRQYIKSLREQGLTRDPPRTTKTEKK